MAYIVHNSINTEFAPWKRMAHFQYVIFVKMPFIVHPRLSALSKLRCQGQHLPGKALNFDRRDRLRLQDAKTVRQLLVEKMMTGEVSGYYLDTMHHFISQYTTRNEVHIQSCNEDMSEFVTGLGHVQLQNKRMPVCYSLLITTNVKLNCLLILPNSQIN